MLQYYGLVGLILIQAAIIFFNGTSEKKRKLFCILCGIELACIIGLRSVNVGIDTFNYMNAFREISTVNLFSIFDYSTHMEKGFILFNKILSLISLHHQIFFIVSAVIIMWSVMSLIYRNVNMVWLSVLIYISAFGDFMWALSFARQALAVAIILLSYDYIKKRKLFPFLILLMLAALFHKTALCFLIAYPLYRIRFNFINITLAIFICGIVFLNLNYILEVISSIITGYQVYLGGSGMSYITDILIRLLLLIFPLTIFMLRKEKWSEEINLLLWLAFFSVSFSIFFLKLSYLFRIGLYFSIFQILLIPKTFEIIKNKTTKLIFLCSFLFCTFLFGQKMIMNGAQNTNLLPYEFFWQNSAAERRWNFTDGYLPW